MHCFLESMRIYHRFVIFGPGKLRKSPGIFLGLWCMNPVLLIFVSNYCIASLFELLNSLLDSKRKKLQPKCMKSLWLPLKIRESLSTKHGSKEEWSILLQGVVRYSLAIYRARKNVEFMNDIAWKCVSLPGNFGSQYKFRQVFLLCFVRSRAIKFVVYIQ